MNPNEIKAHLLLAGYPTIKSVALKIRERRDTVSAVIHYLRPNPRIRRKIEQIAPVRFDDCLITVNPRNKKAA